MQKNSEDNVPTGKVSYKKMSRITKPARYTSYCNRGLPYTRRKRGSFDQSRKRRHRTAKHMYYLLT
jgi:hypothetical protein